MLFALLAVLAYLVAMAIPVYLLYHFGARSWFWHALTIVAAITMGFVPTPATLHTPLFDLLFGFVFIAAMVWGVGGLVVAHRHTEKHA